MNENTPTPNEEMNGNTPAPSEEVSESSSATSEDVSESSSATSEEVSENSSATSEDVSESSSATSEEVSESSSATSEEVSENSSATSEEKSKKAEKEASSKEKKKKKSSAPKEKRSGTAPGLSEIKSSRTPASSERRISVLGRTAKEVRNYRVRKKILTTALVCLTVFTMMLYGVSALYKKSGSFTVSLDKYEMTKYGLTLSESRDMSHNNSHLNAKISEQITNIAGETIADNVDMIDGVHNGQNYIAYTFYLQNAGEVEFSYDYQVNVNNITQGLDEAIRLRLYVDGVPTTYAKTRSDGGGAEPGTVEFYSANVIAKGRVDGFMPTEITKFTVVIWIEGNDPDCIDWLIGGQLKVDMLMSVVH